MKKLHTFEEFFQLNEDLRTQNLELLKDFINDKFVCTVDYRGERIGDILDGVRIIEPYTVGVMENGDTYLRAWLIKGISKTGKADPRVVPGWRLFRIDRIKTINSNNEKFEVPKKGYNDKDTSMSEILFTAAF
jgi:predicted DNA-binding transcriptional regulator YafY